MRLFNPKISAMVCTFLLLGVVTAEAQIPKPNDDACSRDPACERHYLEARSLSKAGQLAEALKQYREAYAIQSVPTLLFNIARLNHKLGRLKEAADAYQEYLRLAVSTEGPNTELQNKAKDYLAQIQPESGSASPPSPPLTAKTPPPAPPPIVVSLAASDSPTEKQHRAPVYKRPWFWGVMGTVGVVVVAGVITGAVLGTRGSGDAPDDFEIQDRSLRSQP